ncbi:TRAP transporter small permease [uncultured Massilia sp.]|uniref:TRAP transporter small permease n=1 Tax=uncultured Massilia sp. TaxID=169973 RepID=UPI0025F015D1|nr:TRAP transporter small permease [uncultured Massilia sp.]
MQMLERWLQRIEAVCQWIAGLLILAIMLIVFADVIGRYLFNSPLRWAYDLINLYLMAGLFFLSLSFAHAAQAHVGVDIVVQKLSDTGRRYAECLACLVALPLFGLICRAGAGRAWTNWENGDAMSGLIAWPTWVGAALMALGSGVLVLRLALRLVGNLASLATGTDVVAPPAAHGHAGGE